MEQTITFLNEAFAKQGNILIKGGTHLVANQKVKFTSPCDLEYINDQANADESKRVSGFWLVLDLDTDDPRMITVGDNGGWYNITADHREEDGERNHTVSTTFLGMFLEKDIAQKVAKAYIHAIVLCHKPEAPPLF
jgi:hypothetical protein